MINLLLGASGSGKSYEAVAFHILTAVQRGRKVITNMPLNMEAWAKLDPGYPDLIELRKRAQPVRGSWEPTREQGAFNVRPEDEWVHPDVVARPFAGVWDYYTEWKHPETGQGPLFVVDEAQNCIPSKKTETAVEEWVALHRHWTVDVLYLTQSYGKLSQAIRENVQMVYRCRKKVAWGQPDKYIRKVQDGLRGEVMNEGERKYESKYFGLYKSHTQGGSGNEASADDVRPWWKHWSFMGAAACLLFVVGMFAFGPAKVNPLSNGIKKDSKLEAGVKPVSVVETVEINGKIVKQVSKDTAQEEADKAQRQADENSHPYAGRGIHVVGTWIIGKTKKALFAISQNGQRVSDTTSVDLELAGYKLDVTAPCVVKVTYGQWSKWAICDAPQIAVVPAGSPESGGQLTKKSTAEPPSLVESAKTITSG